jgi:superfamily II DNA/RNA helicase
VHRIGRTGRAGASGLALTLVSREDIRLVGDIEKLIKKKIEIEAFDLDDERPRRPRRSFDEERPARRAADEAVAPDRAPRRAPEARHSDPFFDTPYEPSGSGEPSWDSAKNSAPAVVRQLAPNIRARKKTAALLGGGAR